MFRRDSDGAWGLGGNGKISKEGGFIRSLSYTAVLTLPLTLPSVDPPGTTWSPTNPNSDPNRK